MNGPVQFATVLEAKWIGARKSEIAHGCLNKIRSDVAGLKRVEPDLVPTDPGKLNFQGRTVIIGAISMLHI